MKQIRQFGLVFGCFLVLAALSACGGGSSSSGVGKSAATAFNGRYAGFGEVTFTAPGVLPETYPIVIIIVINPDGTVILDPETPLPGTGTVTGNIITAAYPASIGNSPGVTCTGAIGVNGTIAAQTITGTIGPSTTFCNGIPITAQGTYTANRVSVVPTPPSSPSLRSQGVTLGEVLRSSTRLTQQPDSR